MPKMRLRRGNKIAPDAIDACAIGSQRSARPVAGIGGRLAAGDGKGRGRKEKRKERTGRESGKGRKGTGRENRER